LGDVQSAWGGTLLILGAVSALGGILYALMQSNLKRLLAYSSVENMGIIFMVLGLSMIFKAQGHPHIAALGFIAALFHAFNHSLFKNLLFLGAGVIQHPCLDRACPRKIIPYTLTKQATANAAVNAKAAAETGIKAVACFVKVYGMIFLGQARSRHGAKAQEIEDKGMLAGLGVNI
jgi:NADH:ubiquinone oxidoreductase subunit 5 (subunit L)/multisubunit Na+/H+ antiporter MnhA subunit